MLQGGGSAGMPQGEAGEGPCSHTGMEVSPCTPEGNETSGGGDTAGSVFRNPTVQ